MNKKLILGFSIIFSVLLLAQTSVVFAVKPIKVELSVSFSYNPSFVTYQSFETIELDKKRIRNYNFIGEMAGNFGFDFNIFETKVAYLDNDGFTTKFKGDAICTLSHSFGTLTIKMKYTMDPFLGGIGAIFQSGKWTVIGGTGIFAEAKGGGIMTNTYEFEGNLRLFLKQQNN